MTQEARLLALIGEADERYLHFAEGACPSAVRTRLIGLKWAVIAACLVVLLAGCIGVMSIYLPPKTPPEPHYDEFVMYAPGTSTWIDYDGRTYSYYDMVSPRVMTVGEALGEGVCSSAYEPETTNVMMYAVKGIDPSFMITTIHGYVYICDNDITLRKGADIFETRLRLKERYMDVKHSVWVGDEPVRVALAQQYHDEFEVFLNALYEGDCVKLSDVTSRQDEKGKTIGRSHGLFITLDNGLQIALSLYDGGYVAFDGLDAAVKMEETVFESFCALLDELKGSRWKMVTYPNRDAIKAEMEEKEERAASETQSE